MSADFVAHMEEVLDLYAEPYDPKRPVVCFDETSTQLLAETRAPMPPRPGRQLSLLKEFYSSTPSRYPAGHAQEPSRPNAPGRKLPKPKPKSDGKRPPATRAKDPETAGEARREYEQARNRTPERMEYRRLREEERRRQAKLLGLCKNCSNPAIAGQTRCLSCAEKHRQSRRRNYANRRAAVK